MLDLQDTTVPDAVKSMDLCAPVEEFEYVVEGNKGTPEEVSSTVSSPAASSSSSSSIATTHSVALTLSPVRRTH